MGAPKVERVSFLARIVEPIVNCRDATNRPRFVIQARLDYVRLDAEPGHAGCGRAANAASDSGTLWARPFFARAAGNVHTFAARSISDQRSERRAPVKKPDNRAPFRRLAGSRWRLARRSECLPRRTKRKAVSRSSRLDLLKPAPGGWRSRRAGMLRFRYAVSPR
jgi:hypothetical protein